MKKSVPFTLFVPSNEGRLLKFLGRVAMVLAPFSRSLCLYFDITIILLLFYLLSLPSKYLFEYNEISAIFYFFILFNNIFFIFLFYNKHQNFKYIVDMGIGDWGLGIGDCGLGQITNPQYPIPNHK